MRYNICIDEYIYIKFYVDIHSFDIVNKSIYYNDWYLSKFMMNVKLGVYNWCMRINGIMGKAINQLCYLSIVKKGPTSDTAPSWALSLIPVCSLLCVNTSNTKGVHKSSLILYFIYNCISHFLRATNLFNANVNVFLFKRILGENPVIKKFRFSDNNEWLRIPRRNYPSVACVRNKNF